MKFFGEVDFVFYFRSDFSEKGWGDKLNVLIFFYLEYFYFDFV